MTALLEQRNDSNKSVSGLSLTSKPPGVHTTTLRPKQRSLGKIHSCSTSGGPTGLRIWKSLGLHFPMKFQGLIKGSICPWIEHLLVGHPLLFFGCQESDQRRGLPLPPLTSGQGFPPPPYMLSLPQVYQTLLTRRMNTWTNKPSVSSSAATTHSHVAGEHFKLGWYDWRVAFLFHFI